MYGISDRKINKIPAQMALLEAILLCIIARLSVKNVEFADLIDNLGLLKR